MKHLLPIVFSLVSISLFSQVSVNIVPSDTIVCYRDSVAFTAVVNGFTSGKLTYRWQFNLQDIPGATDSIHEIGKVQEQDTGYYRCILLLNDIAADTSNTGHLRMHPKMKIDTFYRSNALGCYSDCKGQYRTRISGGAPFSVFPDYIYEWGGGNHRIRLSLAFAPAPIASKLQIRWDAHWIPPIPSTT